MTTEERELKLTPADAALLDRLWDLSELGFFHVAGRRTEVQRNGYFDTRDRALGRARLGFRRRLVEGEPLATWTLKAEGSLARGIATRPEIELRLSADMAPALALGALRQAAHQRGAVALAEEVSDALSGGRQPLAEPVLELATRRRILDLTTEDWRAELTLDDVHMTGHAAYAELEIEVELKRGDDAALESARSAIEAIGNVRESTGSKLSRALEHLERCRCE